MELFNYYENVVFEAITLLINRVLEEGELVEKAYIEEFLQKELGPLYEDIGDVFKDDIYSLFYHTEDGLYYPLSQENVPMLLNSLEKEAILSALDHENVRTYLMEEESEEIRELLEKDFTPTWNRHPLALTNIQHNRREVSEVDEEKIRDLRFYIDQRQIITATNHTYSRDYCDQTLYPLRLEYTPGQNLWTLAAYVENSGRFVNFNISRLDDIRTVNGFYPKSVRDAYQDNLKKHRKKAELVFRGSEVRLERAFRQFSSYNRKTEYDAETEEYRMELEYYDFDESRLLNIILQAGSLVTVQSPKALREEVIRLIRCQLQQ